MMNEDYPLGFGIVTRGALPTGSGIVCDIGPTSFSEMYLDKNSVVPLDITINGKHKDLKVLSDRLNDIHSSLTRRKNYPDSEKWQIIDIKNSLLPQKIGREENNEWLMASELSVEFLWKGD